MEWRSESISLASFSPESHHLSCARHAKVTRDHCMCPYWKFALLHGLSRCSDKRHVNDTPDRSRFRNQMWISSSKWIAPNVTAASRAYSPSIKGSQQIMCRITLNWSGDIDQQPTTSYSCRKQRICCNQSSASFPVSEFQMLKRAGSPRNEGNDSHSDTLAVGRCCTTIGAYRRLLKLKSY